VNDLELHLRAATDPNLAPSSPNRAAPRGPVSPAPRDRGTFPTRPSSTAVGGPENRKIAVDPFTVISEDMAPH